MYQRRLFLGSTCSRLMVYNREAPHSVTLGASTQSHEWNVPTVAYVGLADVPPARRAQALRVPAPFVRCNLRTRSDCARQPGGLSAMLMGSKSPSSIGTPNMWFASAFTQGRLPWNWQTLLGCQCAIWVPALGLTPYGLMAPMRTFVV